MEEDIRVRERETGQWDPGFQKAGVEIAQTIEHHKAEDGSNGGEEEEFGERRPMKKHDPKEPTEAERRDHKMTHLPFRS